MKTISSSFTLSVRNYNENNTCNYGYMNICKPPVIIWRKKEKGYSKSLTLKKKGAISCSLPTMCVSLSSSSCPAIDSTTPLLDIVSARGGRAHEVVSDVSFSSCYIWDLQCWSTTFLSLFMVPCGIFTSNSWYLWYAFIANTNPNP